MTAGGPIYIQPDEETRIKKQINLENTCQEAKDKLHDGLIKAWQKTQQYTKPFLYEPKNQKKLSNENIKYLVGSQIVSNELENAQLTFRLKDSLRHSYFSIKRDSRPSTYFKPIKQRISPGHITLMRGFHGGFLHPPKQNNRLDLEKVLEVF
jgi:hypothetical protein